MKKLDWDRVERERRAGEHGTTRAPTQVIRGVPPSDNQVAKLCALGYRGTRPGAVAEGRAISRDLARSTRGERWARRFAHGDRRIRRTDQIAADGRAYRSSETASR